MCENCPCLINGGCFYGGTSECCPCDHVALFVSNSEDDDTQTMKGNGVSWSDFFAK